MLATPTHDTSPAHSNSVILFSIILRAVPCWNTWHFFYFFKFSLQYDLLNYTPTIYNCLSASVEFKTKFRLQKRFRNRRYSIRVCVEAFLLWLIPLCSSIVNSKCIFGDCQRIRSSIDPRSSFPGIYLHHPDILSKFCTFF